MMRASRIGAKNFREINLLLTEGLFFYRKDNRFLFNVLREHAAFFREFWRRCHGQELVVEQNMAYRRLAAEGADPDAGFRNANIPIAGRHLFAWTGRGQGTRSIIFMLFLRYYEEVLRRQEANEDGERRFFYHEFYQYVQNAFTEFFKEAAKEPPSDDVIFQSCEDVFAELERFRFIEHDDQATIEAGDDRPALGSGYGRRVVIMFRALDGLRAYDPHTLIKPLFERTFVAKEDADTPAGSE